MGRWHRVRGTEHATPRWGKDTDTHLDPEGDRPPDQTDRPVGPSAPLAGPEQSLQQYQSLLDVNNAIISNLTRDSLLHAISAALRKVVPFDRAVLYDAEHDVLRTFALEGRELSGHTHDAQTEISPQGTAVGWAFEH